MDATLKLTSNTLAYADLGATSNPSKRYIDWSVQRSYPVVNPQALPYSIPPGATLNVFSGITSTGISDATGFSLAPSPSDSATRYRFSWTSIGANPSFRTDRALNTSTHVLTLTANSNSTLTVVSGTSGEFSSVVIGDTVFIPDTTTGDPASPFNFLNVGYWIVIGKTGTTTLQLARPTGTGFIGVSEVVTPASAAQFQAYSPDGVQVGDSVSISAGFASTIQGVYKIVAINPIWFEVITTKPIPVTASAVPTMAGIIFYNRAKRYIRIESDQEVVVRLNGDTGDYNRMTPWAPADQDNTAFYEKVGSVWSASIVNKSTETANILFISAE